MIIIRWADIPLENLHFCKYLSRGVNLASKVRNFQCSNHSTSTNWIIQIFVLILAVIIKGEDVNISVKHICHFAVHLSPLVTLILCVFVMHVLYYRPVLIWIFSIFHQNELMKYIFKFAFYHVDGFSVFNSKESW